jgi:transcriptional regulator with XRE-family HTH domain
VPDRIRQERQRLGLTASEVAEALDVGVGDVAAWEHGEAEPTTCQLKGLSELFCCSPDCLLGLAPSAGCEVDGSAGRIPLSCEEGVPEGS